MQGRQRALYHAQAGGQPWMPDKGGKGQARKPAAGGEDHVADFVFSDPWSLALAVLAVALVGLGKGGLAGVGVLSVPLMALIISPVQAAGILLPILLVSDAFSLWAWWGSWDRRTLWLMLPGAMVGIGIGWLTAALVSDAMVRLIIGVIAVAFVLRWFLASKARRAAVRPHDARAGSFWGALAGYTSFVAHAGGPPFQVYTMPLNMDPRILTGTSVVFFAVVNVVKLLPYFALGQFDAANLVTSAVLMPLVAVFTLLGAALIRRMRTEVFYPITYALTMMVGIKLVWDGLAAML